MSKKPKIQRVHIWDDPESRINFLETTLRDKEWEAVIYEPVEQGTGRLPALKKELDEKNYKTTLGKDANGIPTLTITHFSHETSLLKSFQELGFTRGIKHSFDNAGASLSQFIKKAKDTASFLVSNPAKITGFIYLLGDLVFSFGSSGEKDENAKGNALQRYIAGFKDKDNALTRTYGYLGALQSLIFMSYATEGPEQYRNEFQRKLKEANVDQKSLSEVKEWLNKPERKNIHRTIEKNAITIGSIVQIVGRMLYIGRGYMIYNKGKTKGDQGNVLSGLANMIDGSLSISGWIALASKPKKYDDKDKASWTNPKRYYQELRSNTEKFASGVFLGSSLLGIASGLAEDSLPEGSKDIGVSALYKNIKSGLKDPEKRKEMLGGSILIGNSIYLSGDVLVGTLPKDKYEGGQIDESELLAELTAQSVKDLDLIMGEQEKQEVLHDIAEYYVNSTMQAKEKADQPSPEHLALIVKNVEKGAKKILAAEELTTPLEELANRAADLTLRFGLEQRNSVIEALSNTLATSEGIAANINEIKEAIKLALANKEVALKHKGVQLSKAIMAADVKKPLAALVSAIPGEQTAQEAMDLYAAIQPFVTRSQSNDAEKFANHINQQQQVPFHQRINQTTETGMGAGLT